MNAKKQGEIMNKSLAYMAAMAGMAESVESREPREHIHHNGLRGKQWLNRKSRRKMVRESKKRNRK